MGRDNIKAWNEQVQLESQKYNEKKVYEVNKKLKVMVGDYSIKIAAYTNNILKSIGINAEFFPSTDGIINNIDKNYDCIITNKIYPNSSCEELLDILKEKKLNIPIILLSSNSNDKKEFKEDGFTDFICKPLTQIEAINVLSNAISGLKFKKIKK